MKWFKHDTDASIDAKLQELLLDYGASGYGLYWYCVELIAQNVDEKNITFELEHDARIIARNLNLTIQETKDMMSKMIDLELFSISKNEKLACYTLAKRLDQSMTSNKGFREVISKIKEQNHDKVMINHDKVMQEEKREEQNKTEESITKEIKKPSLKMQIEDKLSEYNNINLEAFSEWIDHKKYKSITPITKLLNMLTKHDYYAQQEMVDNSIMNNYAGIFEPKGKPKQKVYRPVNGMSAAQFRDHLIEKEMQSNGYQDAINQ